MIFCIKRKNSRLIDRRFITIMRTIDREISTFSFQNIRYVEE